MLKSKLKVSLILLTILLLVLMPFSLADDENQVEPISSQDQSTPVQTAQPDQEDSNSNTNATSTDENSFKKSDVYLAGDNITVDYIIDGNAFIIADTVTISSQIGGDAFICAKTINITEQGYIFSNLFAVSESLNIDGVVYDVYSCANTVTVSGYIYRDLKATCDTLNIFGTIGRNAFASTSNINFMKTNGSEQSQVLAQGNVSGDLNYSSKSEISIPENVVAGNVNFSAATSSSKGDILKYVISLLTFLVLVSIVWLLLSWLAPKFLTNAETLLTKKPLPVLGFGALTLILLPILAIILLLLKLASSAGLLLIVFYILLICLSTSIFLITVSNIICKKFNITKKALSFVVILVTSAILWGASFIPYIGILLKLVCMLFGLGILVKAILPSKKEIKE